MNFTHFRSMIDNKTIDVKEFILNNYVALGLDEVNAILIMHIYDFYQSGKKYLSMNALSQRVTLNLNELAERLSTLVEQGYLSIEIDNMPSGKQREFFTLDPLYDKIIKLIFDKGKHIESQETESTVKDIVELFQIELGRTLSPIELEIVSGWLTEDKHSSKLIRQALKEAIANNVRSLKYIDRILFNWKKNNIKTIKEAKEYGKKFRRIDNDVIDADKLKGLNDMYFEWLD